MRWSEDGSEVTLDIKEFHLQVAQIAQSRQLYLDENKRCNELSVLLADLAGKEELLNRNAHLTGVARRLETARREMLSKCEHLMREAYHVLADVGRENRTNLEEHMVKLKPTLKSVGE